MTTKTGKEAGKEIGKETAKPSAKDQPPRWEGEAVEDKPGDEAERAAARAEGNAPVRADAESQRLHHPDIAEEPQASKRREPGIPEQDIEAAAEEHAARHAAEGAARGKL